MRPGGLNRPPARIGHETGGLLSQLYSPGGPVQSSCWAGPERCRPGDFTRIFSLSHVPALAVWAGNLCCCCRLVRLCPGGLADERLLHWRSGLVLLSACPGRSHLEYGHLLMARGESCAVPVTLNGRQQPAWRDQAFPSAVGLAFSRYFRWRLPKHQRGRLRQMMISLMLMTLLPMRVGHVGGAHAAKSWHACWSRRSACSARCFLGALNSECAGSDQGEPGMAGLLTQAASRCWRSKI